MPLRRGEALTALRAAAVLAGGSTYLGAADTCYNMLKLTWLRHFYEPGNPAYLDYYERTLFNHEFGVGAPGDLLGAGVLGVQERGPGADARGAAAAGRDRGADRIGRARGGAERSLAGDRRGRGDNIDQYTCAWDPNKEWTFNFIKVLGGANVWQIKNVGSGMCAEVYHSMKTNLANIDQCGPNLRSNGNFTPNQEWVLNSTL